MRQYSIVDYPRKQKELFKFLVDEYRFEIIEDVEEDLTYLTTYRKGDVRVDLNYDIKDNCYYFRLIKGRKTKFPNDGDRKNIISFFRLFRKYDKNIDLKKLDPDDQQYEEALKLNAALLKKYGDKVLKGEKWI